MRTNFQFLGPAHLAILAMVPLLAVLPAAIQRRLPPGSKWLRVSLAVILLSDWAFYYGHLAARGQLSFPDHIPMELCDVTFCLILLALLTLNRPLFDVAYYTALAGAPMALLTPNLLEPFPTVSTVQFFVAHGLVATGALYLIWSKQARPRPGSAGRAMLAVNLYAAFAGAFDWIFKTDYMYLRSKPQNASLLSYLGPWPWYILAAEGVAYALFLLLYLPFRPFTAKAI